MPCAILPGVGGKNSSQGQFLKYFFAPLIGAAIVLISLEAWVTGGDQTGPTNLTYMGLLAGTSIALGGAWIAYLLVSFREARLKMGRAAGLTLALLLTAASIASGEWLLVKKLFQSLTWPVYIIVAPPLLLFPLGLAVVLFVGLTSKLLLDEDREWLSRAGAWLLLFIVGWLSISALALQAPGWLLHLHTWARSAIAAAGGLGAFISTLGGLSSKIKSSQKSGTDEKSGLNSTILDLALKLAAAVFVVVLLAGLALLINVLLFDFGPTIAKFHSSPFTPAPVSWQDHAALVENTPVEVVLIFAAAFFAFAWLMARCININRFSLHAMYRDRLIRAYLGASNDEPSINKFTGFDKNDNLKMLQIRSTLKPFHVVNTTLNLVAGKRLDWQQRKAEPFTISPLHCGNSSLGYRLSNQYGGKGGISLGTAMALSGAAASPNMGYYSSPVLGFIMTLLNARLGAWLGNPGPCGSSTWRQEGPNSAVESLVREAFGLTDETCPYVYLSDGGHFENLGIYEMVKRGCRYVIVIDGAADGALKFGDLGNALRKIRIDTGVDLRFQEGWEQALNKREKRWAVATICYRAAGLGEDGYLIYIKPLMCGTEPPDVVAYQAVNPDFPHQSTANQFFNESQTESYRMLGFATVNEMCEGWKPGEGFSALVDHVRSQKVKKPEIPMAVAAGQKS